ncbi:MAG TPA: hypothetical protein VFP68_02655 [Burkholderiaceae bacterium]|nr:hypothetical protein [Burkholderiaceae bacterium]
MSDNPLRQRPDDQPVPRGRAATDRMHAPFAIVRSLDQLHLSAWTHRLLNWLRHYDGFEQEVPEELDPLLAVRDLLAGYAARSPAVDIAVMVREICKLEVPHYHAAWVDKATQERRPWMPLQEPWLAFLMQGQSTEELRVWWSPQTCPSEDSVRRFLLPEAQPGKPRD